MVSFCINYSLANWNCAATLEMCILHSMTSALFQFLCIITISKGWDGVKGSNYLLRFGAWDVLIEDKIGEMSSGGFWKEPQLENAVQTAVMWDSPFCVTRTPPTMDDSPVWFKMVINMMYSNKSTNMVVPFILVSIHWQSQCKEQERKRVHTSTKKFQAQRKIIKFDANKNFFWYSLPTNYKGVCILVSGLYSVSYYEVVKIFQPGLQTQTVAPSVLELGCPRTLFNPDNEVCMTMTR